MSATASAAGREPYEPLGYDEHKAIFDRYYPSDSSPRESPAETIRAVCDAYHCDRRAVRGVLAFLDLLEELGGNFPASDKKWKEITSQRKTLQTYRVSWTRARKTYGHLRRFQQERTTAQPPGSPDSRANSHLVERLSERDRLKMLIATLPDPEAYIVHWGQLLGRRLGMDPAALRWPGCLSTDEMGHLRPAPFVQLYEHLRDDPHWADLGLIHVPDEKTAELFAAAEKTQSRLPWTVVYEQIYLSLMVRLVMTSQLADLSRVHEIYESRGEPAPLPLPAFVMGPIREALRSHLGRGPLSPAYYSPIYHQGPGCTHRKFELHYRADVIARGVDMRPGAHDNEVAAPLVALHRGFRESVLSDATPRDLVRLWNRLQERGAEIIAWLDSISAETLARGTCSGCDPTIASSMLPTWERHAQAWFGGSAPSDQAGAVTGRTGPDDPKDSTAPGHQEVAGSLETFQQTLSLEAGETKKIVVEKVPEGHVMVLEGIGPLPPEVIGELVVDRKRFRF